MLEITSKPALLGIRTQKVKLNIRQRPNFTVKNTPPKMVVESELPYFTIEKTNQQSQFDFGKASDKPANVTNDLIDNVKLNGKDTPIPDNKVKIETVQKETKPIEMPKLQWSEGKLIVDWLHGEFEIKWDKQVNPEVLYEPSSLEIFMLQYPELKIEHKVTENNSKINKNIKNKGKYVDKYI